MRTLLLSAILFIGCGGPLELDADEEALKSAGMVVRTSATQSPPKWATTFGINTTNTLYIAAELKAAAGPHTVAFEVYEPMGNIYQRNEVAFSGSGRVFDAMPIAGTWIQTFAMTGTWQVKVFVDGAPTPSGTAGFTLR